MTARRMPAKRPGADRKGEMIAEAFFLHERDQRAKAARLEPMEPVNLERYRPADGSADNCSRCRYASLAVDGSARIWCQMRQVNPRATFVCDYWQPTRRWVDCKEV